MGQRPSAAPAASGRGNSNAGTLTYNLGGFATGIDYRLDPRVLVGLGIGYGSGNQWVGGLNGRGTSDKLQRFAFYGIVHA